ncbi:MAG TPA: phytanoyl-CoA dioxygenase family protein [Ktedonobacter sp.]|nr:phytanoyl-CoA dioxygenase family protein [Ktedonobacter sp.]
MSTTSVPTEQQSHRAYERYRVSVQEYVTFQEQGFLVVHSLVPPEDVQEFVEHTENLMAGREVIPGRTFNPSSMMGDQMVQELLRVHMLHRLLPIHERFLLHPRILDVLEALIGPDVLALQSMLFFKHPGQEGQGYHQDSYYIPTLPDTLCGAWLAIDRADEENGCLWMTVGSQNEPVYPDARGATGQRDLSDMQPIAHASHNDVKVNGLTRIARKYEGREVKAEVDPGDVVFFGGHIIHRSHENRSQTRMRRAFVGHYCNARSWVPWNHGFPYEGEYANDQHILARGTTPLPYAQPLFGTLCTANQPQAPRIPSSVMMSMMGDDDGMMTMTSHAEETDDDGKD